MTSPSTARTGEPQTGRQLLLTRQGLVFVSSAGPRLPDEHVRAVELELAGIGYVLSARLRERLLTCTLDELTALRAWALRVLLAHKGGDQRHEPLFRSFPAGVPADTSALWWRKVLVHFLQAEGQPCLTCGQTATTHVLDPCLHVVCDRCFDGASYSACPVCEHHVDRSSPFFRHAARELGQPVERVTFSRLDLGGRFEDAAKALFVRLCERTQALSPDDREALTVLVRELGSAVLEVVPRAIPVRENRAVVFGTLFGACDPAAVLPHARAHMTTATDVLRFIAVISGTDGSLLPETAWKTVDAVDEGGGRFWGRIAALLGARPPQPVRRRLTVPIRVHRFKVAKLPRALRRALLAVLEGLDPDRLTEDLLRHRSYWVWVGELLHPHEYAARFPAVARAFQLVRGRAPDGTPAPAWRGWSVRFEGAVDAGDAAALVTVLEERPGELARRLDHGLRVASADPAATGRLLASFAAAAPRLATPVLLTLRSHLPARRDKATRRVYWPKGRVALGVSGPDERAPLAPEAIAPAVAAVEAELLSRFAAKPPFAEAVIDEGLRDIVVPFNERTASAAAIPLPRGSRIAAPTATWVRLFLHWCQPEQGGFATDLDLSVGLYDAAWRYAGVSSYYQLQHRGADGGLIAQSAGDLRDAPWPDGATELVDLHRERALAAGVRYAVMVVNAYAGMPFGRLERAFAGLMGRDDPGGAHFDPRTVELKFALAGEHGIYLPLVLDLELSTLHWLDAYSPGALALNTAATSQKAITRVCPELMAYFASGVRPSMLDLACLHAAARCRRVLVRGASAVREHVRRPGEDAALFHARLVRGDADEPRSRVPADFAAPVLAVLHRGDLDLPERSEVYALFRDRVTPSLAASDLLR